MIDLLAYDEMVMWWACRFHAKRPVRDSEEYADGWVGLINAARCFDPTKINPRSGQPFEFSTYAYHAIRNTINRRRIERRTRKRGGGKIKKERIETVPFSLLDFYFPGDKDDDSFSATLAVAPKEPDPADEMTVERLLSRICPRRAEIVRRAVMLGESHRDIAGSMGLSHTRINQLCEEGLTMLRRAAGVRIIEASTGEGRT